MSVPKHYVFDDEGKLTEVRGYKDEVVVERWGIVYDEEDKPVGLKPLPVREVIPQSVLDRMKFWRKPKPLTQILSVDFIGLIQYIGLINKINKIKNIELIDEITTIKNIEHATVDTLTTIRDLTHTPRSFIINPFWHQGFAGWFKSGTINIIETEGQPYYLEFLDDTYGSLEQHFPIPLGVNWFEEMYCFLRSIYTDSNLIIVKYMYSDRTTSNNLLQVSEPNIFEKKVLTPVAGNYIDTIIIEHTSTWKHCNFGWLTTRFLEPL